MAAETLVAFHSKKFLVGKDCVTKRSFLLTQYIMHSNLFTSQNF